MHVRRVLVISTILPLLAACGGGGSGTSASSSAVLPATPGGAASTSFSASSVTIKEKKFANHTLGGITVARDGLVYLSCDIGLMAFDTQTNLKKQCAKGLGISTWPVSPKTLTPTGAVAASGTTVNALASAPAGTHVAAAAPLEPALVQYDVFLNNFTIQYGPAGGTWDDVTGDANGQVYVLENLPGSPSGFVGDVRPFPDKRGICTFPESFVNPLAAETLGPDGQLWIATDTTRNSPGGPTPSQIIVASTDQTTNFQILRTYALPPGSQVSSLAAAPGGVLFTDSGLNAIGRADTTGGVHFFYLKGSGRGLEDIAMGSDGAFWFAEGRGNKIGRIDAALTTLNEFNVPSANSHPHGLVGCTNGSCPQRAVFFTEDQALGKVSF